MAEMDLDFSQIKDVRIPQGQVTPVKYIADSYNLIWRRPNEFPYVIGAYTDTNGTEFFSSYYIEKFEEPVYVKASYLPTYNGSINTSAYLMATPSLVGTTLNGYYCSNETDCQNLHISSARKKLGKMYKAYWDSLDNQEKKILVYASKGQTQMFTHTPYPQHIEGAPTYLRYQYISPLYLGAGFYIPYGEANTPELCRVLDTTTPIITIERVNNYTNKITSVREDYSKLIEKYETATSGAYPKSEYPYLDGVTELGFFRSIPYGNLGINVTVNGRLGVEYYLVFAFYVFFRVAR